jgi:hypothetical protein
MQAYASHACCILCQQHLGDTELILWFTDPPVAFSRKSKKKKIPVDNKCTNDEFSCPCTHLTWQGIS